MVKGDNLHRVVLFKDDAEKVSTITPLNAQINPDPEVLWAWLDNYQKTTVGKILAIAHNGNLSNGRMFSPYKVNGQPLDQDYVQMRAK